MKHEEIAEKIGNFKTHHLKTWTRYYYAIVNGTKTFELRKNDRNYQVGDTLVLQEYDENENEYTGRECSVVVTYVLLQATHFGLMDGFCIMGFEKEKALQSSPIHKEIELYQKCPVCNGDGYTSEHDSHPHTHGCEGRCPVQAQCNNCGATGYVEATLPTSPIHKEIEKKIAAFKKFSNGNGVVVHVADVIKLLEHLQSFPRGEWTDEDMIKFAKLALINPNMLWKDILSEYRTRRESK